MIVIPAGVDCTIVPSFVWTKHWNVKERQTHRQTDIQTDLLWILQHQSALRAMQTRREKAVPPAARLRLGLRLVDVAVRIGLVLEI